MSENLTDKLVGDLENAYSEIARLKNQKDYLKRSFRPTRNSLQTLSKEFEIPLRIAGVAIEEGEWNGVYWPSKELEKNAEELEGMAITVDHPVDEKDGSLGVMDEVGKITAANWNSSENTIEFEGEIVDEAVARRVFHDTVDAVSIGADVDKSEKNGRMEVEDIISWLELSLVQNPAVPDARVEVLESQKLESDQIQSDEQEVNPLSEEEESKEAQETEEEMEKEPVMEKDLENLEVEEDLQGYEPYGKYPAVGGYYYPNLGEKIGELFKRIEKIEESEEAEEEESEESESEEAETEESEEESKDELEEEIDTLKEVVETLKDEPVKLSKETTEESEDESWEKSTFEWLNKRER